ncbi:ornithine cyclodeaminase family protein [Actinomadura sp. NEAU-AAG7]|uniref:ornithine cyclodeaminase family protein n=1 Tax=Actinomadura sp. NEAU-AAG7 TaxID=2839640 RepID=UPI001BE4C854|nr:ornithine cyclodeaminase family protein [Actinomadura sp. NEAU-AAG7]MBT2211520.1 ornithine cyclodeaminase family protein [Actinomadura sp. NEAU-AAG7]
MTLLLTRSDLESVLDPAACLAELRRGFTAGSAGGDAARRVVARPPGPGTATALLPGAVEGIPAYTVKVNAKFPGSRPALRGVVCLHDLGTGELLALLDSATVTAWRTGLAAALGTHVLARPGADAVAVVGAGAQAELVMRGLAALRPVRRLAVHDLDAGRAEAFAARHGALLGLDASAAASYGAGPDAVREAVRDAGIVVTATWARSPILDAPDVAPGAHVTSLGADEPGKAELAPGLLRAARVVVDDVALAAEMGALAGAGPEVERSAATLGDVLAGRAPGRAAEDGRTVYAPVGLPWQDLALSWAAFNMARSNQVGLAFDFLG